MKNNCLKSLLLFLLAIFLFSCKDDEGNSDPCQSDFDKEAMFANMADNIIVPNINALNTAVNLLQVQTTDFLNSFSTAELLTLRGAFYGSYILWQKVAVYNFGPAEEVFLRSSVNNFPLNLERVNTNIETGIYDFNLPDEYDKGFPALDYLLYGSGNTPEDIAALFQNDEKYRTYLMDVVADMVERINQVTNKWGQSYRDEFVMSTGSAAGSSLSLIINHLNQNYELIKREKIGVPAGVLTLGFTNPENVEAFYSGFSVDLALAALEATEQYFLGQSSNGTNGQGLDDYLIKINAEKDGLSLNEIIKDNFRNAINAVNNLASPLSQTVDDNNASVVSAYEKINAQLVNIKTDMPSVLCVSITYIDNPSDTD